MSKVEPWQGHKKPPGQSFGSEGWGPAWILAVGEQPKWEQIPTTTRYSGLIERYSLRAYAGVRAAGSRRDFGSASSASSLDNSLTWAGLRRKTQTGLPRHSTVRISSGFISEISTSTGAPAALARSEGWKLSINGYKAAAAPQPPTAELAINQVRRSLSIFGVSLIYDLSFYLLKAGFYIVNWLNP